MQAIMLVLWMGLLACCATPVCVSSGAGSWPHSETGSALRVGVVGGGVSGAFASAFLHREAKARGGEVDVVVFEAGPEIGGRVKDLEFDGERIEVGAGIFHASNALVRGACEELGLPIAVQGDERASTYGIWDGESFLWRSGGLSGLAHLAWRYGLAPWTMGQATADTLERFTRIYPLLANGTGFAQVDDLLEALELAALTQRPLRDVFSSAQGGSEGEGEDDVSRWPLSRLWLEEMITSIVRIQYGQDAGINAFAGLVSLVGAEPGALYRIEGGNRELIRKLLARDPVTVHTSAPVRRIHRLEDGRFQLNDDPDPFDAVVLATPLEFARSLALDPHNLGITHDLEASARTFQVTHATFVCGALSPRYFGGGGDATLPDTIGTTEDPSIPFSSISVKGVSATHGLPIFKIFSREELTDTLLDQLFERRVFTQRHRWRAYPVLRPRSPDLWPPFLLAPNLVYVNAMETAVSCLETQALAAQNAINLLLCESSPSSQPSPSATPTPTHERREL